MKTLYRKLAMGLVLFLCFILGGSLSAAAGDAKYTVTPLGTLTGGTYSRAYDINDSGWVVGEADVASGTENGTRGFIWKPGTGMVNLGSLGTRSLARGINNAGKVVGYSKVGDGPGVAFTWTESEGMKELPLAGRFSDGWGINDSDAVVGYGLNEGGEEHGFRWAGATEIDLGSLGGSLSNAYSINGVGNVVGYSATAAGNARAFYWDGTRMNPLSVLADDQDSIANRINNHNQVVGRIDQYYCEEICIPNGATNECYLSCTPTGAQPFFWESGVMKELGTLEGGFGEALGINDAGAVVGWSTNGQGKQAFLWELANENAGMVNLNGLIAAGSGWVLRTATAINNHGQIVGYGDLYGVEQAFLLTPIPQEDPKDPEQPFEVKIDIHPWNHHNLINRHSWWGLVQIAILSEAGFDAPKAVDRESLSFGQKGDENSLAFCMPWKMDVNGDRKKDLICYFYERSSGFQCGDTLGTLKGKTVEGEPFGGQDKVKIAPCPLPKKDNKYKGK